MTGLAADRRVVLGLGGVVAVLVVVTGWFTLIEPVRADTESLTTQESDVRDHNSALARSITALRAQKAALPALRSELEQQVRGMPTDSGLPELTRQLTDQARAAGVGITGVAVGTITSVSPDGSHTTVAGPSTGSSPAAAGAGSAKASTGAASAAGQLYAIPVTVTTTGPASRQIAFLRAVQQTGPRRALVVSTQLAPVGGAAAGAGAARSGASIATASTMTTVLTVFSAPVTPEALAQLERLIAGPSSI